MSELSKLIPAVVEKEIGGIKFKIKPFCVKDMPLLSMAEDPNKRAEVMAKFVERVVKDTLPDATDSEIESLPISVLCEIADVIVEVNGIKK